MALDESGGPSESGKSDGGQGSGSEPSISEESQQSLDGGRSNEGSHDAAASGGSGGADTAAPAADDDPAPTPAEYEASQERLEAQGRLARDGFETRQKNASGYETEAYGFDATPAQATLADHEVEGTAMAEPTLVGNTPGADYVYGAPLTEATQAEVLATSQATVETAAVALGEIDATIEAEMFAARDAFVPQTRREMSAIPGIYDKVTTEFDARGTRADIEAAYADERRAVEFEAQNALNNAALVAGADGLSQMRNAAVMSMDAAGFGPAEIEAITTEGVLGAEGYHRADAFTRAADAWAQGGAQDPAYVSGNLYGPDPAHSTEVLAGNPLNAGNSRLAANLDAITSGLEAAGQPEMAADMRLHAVTQLGDAIYAGETGNHRDVLSVVRDGEPVSDLGRMTQISLSETPEGQAALEQFQNLIDPQRLDGMVMRTGDPVDHFSGISPQRPGSTEEPMGGYPDVIRDTLGPHIDAAIDARGVAAIGLAATLFVPDATDLALVGVLAGASRLSRMGDGLADTLRARGDAGDTTPDVLDSYRPNTARIDPDEATPRAPGVVEQRRQEVLSGHPTAEILTSHRGPTGQIDNFNVRVDGQTWHIPAGRTIDDLPDLDPIGDQLQEFATDAAARWSPARLSPAEADAIDTAHRAGQHYLGNILEAQARGRWVETDVRETMKASGIPNDRPPRGLDYIDPDTRIQYDFMSGTASNLQRHARRESEELFRMITF